MIVASVLAPLFVAVLGALVYALSSNGKVAELGRLAYAVGLLWLVYVVMGDTAHVRM